MASITLDHVVIAASDFTVSDEFYARVLGAKIVVPREDVRFYQIGAYQLNVHSAVPAHPTLVGRIPVAPGNSDVCFEWPGSIEEAIAYLEARGVIPEAGPVRSAGAKGLGWSVYFRDPDGSLLELITYGAD